VTTEDRVSSSAGGERKKYFCRYQMKPKRRKNTREREKERERASRQGTRICRISAFSPTPRQKRRTAVEFSGYVETFYIILFAAPPKKISKNPGALPKNCILILADR